MRRLITTGSPFEKEFAYSRAVVQGDWCFVAGTTGYDYRTMSMPEDPGEQAANALATIAGALEEAGFSLKDVVRTVIYLADPADHPAIGPALIRPEMKVEIEVTALRGG